MKSQGFIDRISFPTEYHSLKDLKTSILLLFFTCVLFFIISSFTITTGFFLFSKTLLLGTIAYELILFYLLRDYTSQFIKKEVKGSAKSALKATNSIVFGLLIIVTLLSLIYSMSTPNPAGENKFISLSIALLMIVSPSFYWHELVTIFKKKFQNYKLIKGIILLLVISGSSLTILNPVIAVNETINESSSFGLMGGIEAIGKSIEFINNLKTSFSNIQSMLMTSLNLSQSQTQVVILIAGLIALFMLLKFLSVIIKWVIVILIAWIIIQMIIL